MFQLTKKLKEMKQALIAWTKKNALADASGVYERSKRNLIVVQESLEVDPLNSDLLKIEKSYLEAYLIAANHEEESHRLKSRMLWLKGETKTLDISILCRKLERIRTRSTSSKTTKGRDSRNKKI